MSSAVSKGASSFLRCAHRPRSLLLSSARPHIANHALRPSSTISPTSVPPRVLHPESNASLKPRLPDHLRSISSQAANRLSTRFWERTDSLSADAVVKFSKLGGKLNEVTGYDQIDALKLAVTERETRIAALRASLVSAKATYLSAVTRRSTSQREVNDLLQRKHLWSTADVERFTVLVREDHENQRDEETSKRSMEEMETQVESAFTELMNSILNRYHEEQLWSDKLRSFSTHVSLGVMLANLAVFVTAIVFVEPWKRKRLADTFERRVVELTGEVEGVVERELGSLRAAMERVALDRAPELARTTIDPVPLESSLLSHNLELPTRPFSARTSRPSTLLPPLASLSVSSLSRVDLNDALVASKTFLRAGWEGEGLERDLLVLGSAATSIGAVLGALLFKLVSG